MALPTNLSRLLRTALASRPAGEALKNVAEAADPARGAVADAEITLPDTPDGSDAITIQLKDEDGNDLTERAAVLILVLADANGDAFATTGGSTGLAAGTDGALIALVAKKVFLAISEADGDIDVSWTNTGEETVAIGVLLPNGKLVISEAFTTGT